MIAITFLNNQQTSIVSSVEELIKEINHFQAFYPSIKDGYYTNHKDVCIKVYGLTDSDKKLLSDRMK